MTIHVRYDNPTAEYRFMHVMPDGDLTDNPDAVFCDTHRGEHVAQAGCVNAEPSSPEPY